MESMEVRILSGVPIMYNKPINILPSLKAGYYQFYDPEHPLAYSNGCVYVHRHIASIKQGSWLTSEQHVHHIDGNVLNNDADNLEVLSSTEHAQKHKGKFNYRVYKCALCDKECTTYVGMTVGKYCSTKCASDFLVKNKTLTKELLEYLMPTHSWKELGNIFGYSDVGIKKRAASLGCDMLLAKNKRTVRSLTEKIGVS